MMILEKKSKIEHDLIVEEYLKKHDPYNPTSVSFNIPEAYRYAQRMHKPFSSLTKEELSHFTVK